MAELKDILAYFCIHYTHPAELSKARLTKMVYLSDWKSAIKRGKQVSDIKWVYNHFGPYVEDVANTALAESIFDIESTLNMHGGNKEVIRLRSEKYKPELTRAEKEILNHIINVTSELYWNAFIELVYSTYPIVRGTKFDELNLVDFASKYNKRKSHSK